MSDVHTQQFQTVQQVAETIAALTQRLSDLRQLAEFMSRTELMAAELAAHRQVAEMAPKPSLADQLTSIRQAHNQTATGSIIQPLASGEEPDTPVPGIPDAVIRRSRKTGGGQ